MQEFLLENSASTQYTEKLPDGCRTPTQKQFKTLYHGMLARLTQAPQLLGAVPCEDLRVLPPEQCFGSQALMLIPST